MGFENLTAFIPRRKRLGYGKRSDGNSQTKARAKARL